MDQASTLHPLLLKLAQVEGTDQGKGGEPEVVRNVGGEVAKSSSLTFSLLSLTCELEVVRS